MKCKKQVKGHAKTAYKLVPLISVNGGAFVGRTSCECGAVSPVLRGDKARRDWHNGHKEEVREATQ